MLTAATVWSAVQTAGVHVQHLRPGAAPHAFGRIAKHPRAGIARLTPLAPVRFAGMLLAGGIATDALPFVVQCCIGMRDAAYASGVRLSEIEGLVRVGVLPAGNAASVVLRRLVKITPTYAVP